MGKFAFLFLIAAAAIGYDAVAHDGAHTKTAWEKVREVGSDIGAKIENGIGDKSPEAPAQKAAVGN